MTVGDADTFKGGKQDSKSQCTLWLCSLFSESCIGWLHKCHTGCCQKEVRNITHFSLSLLLVKRRILDYCDEGNVLFVSSVFAVCASLQT